MTIILYGIKNCDTVKKSQKWFNDNNIDFDFFDFKNQKLNLEIIEGWLKVVSWQEIINKRSTTWRNLPDKDLNKEKAIKLMQQQSTIIKRPVLEFDEIVLLGFDEAKYKKVFNK